ncbi:MAG: PH domain-containing protein [Acidobacteria bacterium]|nr:PH domain-containing protein [Acidobacteriota bacterium]
MQSDLPVFKGRLHPLTLLFGILKGLRGAIPLIPLVFFGGRWTWVPVLFLFTIITIISAIIRYFSFSYHIQGNELITQQGIIERKQRNIPLERVQEISIEQGMFQRLFDVVEAKIETGGGQGAEATLSVLSRSEADRLRRAVFDRVEAIKARSPGVDQELVQPLTSQERIVIHRLGIKDLVIAGLTTNHLVSAMVLAGALWNFADDILPDTIYQRAADLIYSLTRQLAAQGAMQAIIIAAVGVLSILVIGLLFSILGSILLFYGFTFSRRGEDLHRAYGLFTQRASSLPRHRIQVLKIEEKMMRRLVGLATLRADTSGRSRENEDDKEGRDVLIPIIKRGAVDQLMPVIFPDFISDQAEWKRVSKLAIRSGVIKGGMLCLLVTAALFVYQREFIALWPLLFLPIIYLINVLRYRSLGYAMGDRYFRTRQGWLGRSTQIVPINKIQAVEVSQTPIDRRLHLATISVDTAGQAFTGGGPQVSHLPIAEARTIAATLAHKASTTDYKW